MTAGTKQLYKKGLDLSVCDREVIRSRRALRRKQEVRLRLSLILSGLFLVLALSVFSHVIDSHAETDSGHNAKKYYTSILIENGDTLWSLAQEYADTHYADIQSYIEEVIFINHLDSTEILEGNYLILPYYGAGF